MIHRISRMSEVLFIVNSKYTCHCIYLCVFVRVESIVITINIPEEPEHRMHAL